MKFFLIYTFALSSLTSLVAMDYDAKSKIQEEENRLRRNPNLVANLLEGLQKKEQEDNPQQQRNAQTQHATDFLSGRNDPWQPGKNAHLHEQQSEVKKSANPLEIGSQVASSKTWKVGVAIDPEEVKKEYEINVEALKKALYNRYLTSNIQQLLKKLDIPDMKNIWAAHAPAILACAQREAIQFEEIFRAHIRQDKYASAVAVGNNYEITLANKLTVERFDALKMREWFSLHP